MAESKVPYNGVTLNGKRIQYVEKIISLPANNQTSIDFSSELGGKTIDGILSFKIGSYTLPYCTNNAAGTIITWIINSIGSVVQIRNNTTAWTNYLVQAVFITD